MSEKDAQFGFGATFWIPLTRDQFTALGIIATLFGQIETYIDRMVLKLSGLASAADLEIFYDGRQFGAKVNMLRRLAKKCPADVKAAIINACDELEELAPMRNQAIHGLWGRMDQPGTAVDGETMAASSRSAGTFLIAKGLPTIVREVEKGASAVHGAMIAVFPQMAPQPLPWHHLFSPGELAPSLAKGRAGRRPPTAPRDRKKPDKGGPPRSSRA